MHERLKLMGKYGISYKNLDPSAHVSLYLLHITTKKTQNKMSKHDFII